MLLRNLPSWNIEDGLKEAEQKAGSPLKGLWPGSRDNTRVLKHSSVGKTNRSKGWGKRLVIERENRWTYRTCLDITNWTDREGLECLVKLGRWEQWKEQFWGEDAEIKLEGVEHGGVCRIAVMLSAMMIIEVDSMGSIENPWSRSATWKIQSLRKVTSVCRLHCGWGT